MKMKIATLNDTHFGARGDSEIFDRYFKKFYDDIFFPYLLDNDIKAIIHLGDVFDRRKYINYSSLKKCRAYFFDRCRDNDIQIYAITGNHDTYYKNTNDVNSLDLLLGEYSNVTCYSSPTDIVLDGQQIGLLPWICSGNMEESLNWIDNTSSQVVFGHLELQGFEMHRGHFNDHGFKASLFNKFDRVFSGHFHLKSEQGNIMYFGTQYEMTWTDFGDQKGFHVYDTSTREVEYIENPYKIFHKVWYDDLNKEMDDVLARDFNTYHDGLVKVIVTNKTNPYWFDMFIERLEKAGTVDIQVVEDHLNLNLEDDDDIVNEAEDTITILNKYIDQLDVSVDKKKLDSLMRTLYTEALAQE